MVIIDSRIRSDRRQGYITGSISLPDTETDCAALFQIIPAKDSATVFYCNGPKCRRSDRAVEIAKHNTSSLSYRYPVAVSSSFGLLHGFGFASVLADIGLPETEKLLALLCFNIGVEIGQLIFVITLLVSFYVFSKLYKPLTTEKLRLPVSYFCGSLASIWMLERLAAF